MKTPLNAADLDAIREVNETGDYESTSKIIDWNTRLVAALDGFALRAYRVVHYETEYTMYEIRNYRPTLDKEDLLRELSALAPKDPIA